MSERYHKRALEQGTTASVDRLLELKRVRYETNMQQASVKESSSFSLQLERSSPYDLGVLLLEAISRVPSAATPIEITLKTVHVEPMEVDTEGPVATASDQAPQSTTMSTVTPAVSTTTALVAASPNKTQSPSPAMKQRKKKQMELQDALRGITKRREERGQDGYVLKAELMNIASACDVEPEPITDDPVR